MKQMNALELKQALQKALEQLENLPVNLADLPVNYCGSDGPEMLESFTIYYTNEDGNEAEEEEAFHGVTVVVD